MGARDETSFIPNCREGSHSCLPVPALYRTSPRQPSSPFAPATIGTDIFCAAAALPPSRLQASVLVIASQAKSGLSEFFLGSVASYCAHHCDAPTLVLHQPRGEAQGTRRSWLADLAGLLQPKVTAAAVGAAAAGAAAAARCVLRAGGGSSPCRRLPGGCPFCTGLAAARGHSPLWRFPTAPPLLCPLAKPGAPSGFSLHVCSLSCPSPSRREGGEDVFDNVVRLSEQEAAKRPSESGIISSTDLPTGGQPPGG